MPLELTSFEKKIFQHFDTLGLEPSQALLAVSGGSDSMAMMHLFHAWSLARGIRPQFHVVCVDHGLRSGSSEEADFVCSQAHLLGMFGQKLLWSGEKPQKGIQQKARIARYNLLQEYAQKHGLKFILTAHTQDDFVETVVMRLFRGSGLRGLAGIAQARPLGEQILMRPLLSYTKNLLRGYLENKQKQWVEDPSNSNDVFERVRLRSFLPKLEHMGFDQTKILRFAKRQWLAQQSIEHGAHQWLIKHGVDTYHLPFSCFISDWVKLPFASQVVVLEQFLLANGALEPLRLEKIETLCENLYEVILKNNDYKCSLAGFLFGLKKEKFNISLAPPRKKNS